MSAINVLLFDVDGVIVDPRAYRMCITRTLELLLPKLGISNPAKYLPSEADVSYFEAQGIHDVWDITNIIYALVLVATCDWPHGADVPVPDYRTFVDRLMLASGTSHPASVAASLLAPGKDAKLSPEDEKKLADMEEWLPGSRSVYKSPVTRLFQNILLGSTIFKSTYELPSEHNGEPLLKAEDRVLISKTTVAKLKDLHSQEYWSVGIYTSRPSQKPEFAHDTAPGFSPEAELALELAGMSDFPLIGMGTMEYLADRTKDLPQDLVKPNSTQGFAALLCALHGSLTLDLLEQAYEMGINDVSPDGTALHQWKHIALNVHVFEDTVSGIVPMDIVASHLSDHGYKIKLNCLGIAQQESKRDALLKFCPTVYHDVNEAFEYVLSQTPHDAIEGAK